MAISTVDEFLSVLERSNLLKPEEVAEAQRLAQECSDPTSLAKTLVRQGMLSRWQAGQLLVGRSTFFLGKYKLIELLGKGGMGSVFLSEHVMMNRRAALKIIPRQVSKDPAGLERFLAEARTIASVDHPNIVQAYNVDNEADLYYLVMEYVEGLDLQRLVEADGPLDCPSAVDYVRQAADGLAHAHARKMIHCDIKPSNLIVNPQGVVKILDMGLARLVGPEELSGEPSEQDERILGSVDFQAPEQALRTADFDHRADIYSLGCTLYFLLTGHAPFPEGTLTERILKHQNQQPPDIAAERPNVPQSLIEICKKMMAKRPVDRYQTMDQVSEVLAAWRPGEHRVQRALTMKKSQLIDELPGPDLLGMDLSEMFRKGMGVSTTTPLTGKPYEFTAQKSQASRNRTRRLIGSLGISSLVIMVMAAVVIFWPFNQSEKPPVDLDNGSRTIARIEETGSPSPQPGVISQEKENKNQIISEDITQKPPPPPGPDTGPPQIANAQTPPPDIQILEPDTQTSLPDTQTYQPDIQVSQPDTQMPQQNVQPEPPQLETFKDLPTSIDLPEIPKSRGQRITAPTEVALGIVHLPSSADLQLTLIGGEEALKGSGSLVMQQDESINQPLIWRIYSESRLQDTSENPSRRIEIAQLTLNEEKLVFRWSPRITPMYGEALKKCGILARVENEEQFVQLTHPLAANPLVLDLDSGIAEVNLQGELLSEARSLRLQMLDPEGYFPPAAWQPSNELEVKPKSKTEIYLVFTDKKFENFRVKITCDAKGQKLDIKALAIYEILAKQPKTYELKDLNSFYFNIIDKQSKTQISFDKLPNNSPRKAELATELEQLKKTIEMFNNLRELYMRLNNQGKIHYCVFIPYENYQVELFNSHIPTP